MPKTNRSVPSSHRGNNPPIIEADFTDADFEKMRAAEKRHVSDRLERLGVNRGRTPEQQARLTDIVTHYSAKFNQWREHPQFQKSLRTDAKLGAGTRRAVKQRVEKAEKALDHALDRVTKASGRNESAARAFRDLVTPHLQDARKALAAIRWNSARLSEPTITRLKPLGKEFASNPRAEANDTLMNFYIRTCGLTKSQASQRTARIGNHFWEWNVRERDKSESVTPERSRAVLKSYARRPSGQRRSHRDTSKTTRQ
jgi:hypothetical protein